MFDQTLPTLISCPQNRYRIPMTLSGPHAVNQVLEDGIRQYRHQALEEHQHVQSWVMARLDQRLDTLRRTDPDAAPKQQLIQAREQLLREHAIRFKRFPIGGQIVLAVGVPVTTGFYYINLDAFPIPHQALSPEQSLHTWHRLRELQNNFVGLDMGL